MHLVSAILQPTQLPWPTVFANITSPELQWKAACDAFLARYRCTQSDIFDHLSQCLRSQRPNRINMASSNLNEGWCDSWESATGSTSHLWWTLQSGNHVSTFLITHGVRWIIFALARVPVLQIYTSEDFSSSDKCECGMAQTMGDFTFWLSLLLSPSLS